MMGFPERRQLGRFDLRTPLHFRTLNPSADGGDHFTEALNVSRGGFFFASSVPLQLGTPLEAALRMPEGVTGGAPVETRCTARVVHVRSEPCRDGRMGFGVEIESFRPSPAEQRWMARPPGPACRSACKGDSVRA